MRMRVGLSLKWLLGHGARQSFRQDRARREQPRLVPRPGPFRGSHCRRWKGGRDGTPASAGGLLATPLLPMQTRTRTWKPLLLSRKQAQTCRPSRPCRRSLAPDPGLSARAVRAARVLRDRGLDHGRPSAFLMGSRQRHIAFRQTSSAGCRIVRAAYRACRPADQCRVCLSTRERALARQGLVPVESLARRARRARPTWRAQRFGTSSCSRARAG